MQFSVLASSEGRGWTGLDATLVDASGGVAEISSSPAHNLTMHVGTPVVATCVCDGPVQNRLQIPGDIDLIPSGYRATWEDREPTTLLIMNVSPLAIGATSESLGINPDRVSLSPRLQLKDPVLQHIGWALRAELEAGGEYSRVYAESLASALTVQLLRQYAKPSVPRRGLSKRQWKAVFDHIEENISTNLSLSELAAVAGVGTSLFKVLFRQSFGLSTHQYVIRRRVEFAANLMSQDSAAGKDVALQAGFADQSHMARWFRRLLGVTPSDVVRNGN